MFKIFNHIIFFLNITFIISSEFLIYFIFSDYLSFVNRITNRLASVNILYVKIFQALSLIHISEPTRPY